MLTITQFTAGLLLVIWLFGYLGSEDFFCFVLFQTRQRRATGDGRHFVLLLFFTVIKQTYTQVHTHSRVKLIYDFAFVHTR